MAKGKKCCVCDSDYNVMEYNDTNKYYCQRHYGQLFQYGRIFERTKFDPNEIVLYDDYAEIILYDKNNKEKARAIIDLEDVELCKQYKWYLGSTNYPSTHIGDKNIHMHKILITEEGVVDHINQNERDNRRCNLRLTTHLGNAQNKGFDRIVGVVKVPNVNKWRAYCVYDKSVNYLGMYDNYEYALKVRLLFEREVIGEDKCCQRHLFAEYLNESDKLEDYIILPKKSEQQSGVKGVTWAKREGVWRVRYTTIVLGYYKDVDDAIKCRLKYEKDLLGDKAPQYYLFEQYGIE